MRSVKESNSFLGGKGLDEDTKSEIEDRLLSLASNPVTLTDLTELDFHPDRLILSQGQDVNLEHDLHLACEISKDLEVDHSVADPESDRYVLNNGVLYRRSSDQHGIVFWHYVGVPNVLSLDMLSLGDHFSSGGQLKFRNDVIIPSSRLEPSSLFVHESADSERFDDKMKFDCDQVRKMSVGLAKASSALGRIVE